MWNARGAEIVHDLRPFDLRYGLYGLQLHDELAVEAREVGPPDRWQRLPVIIDANLVFSHIRYAHLRKFDLHRIPVCRFEKAESKRGVYALRTPHYGIRPWIVPESHAAYYTTSSTSQMPLKNIFAIGPFAGG